MAKDRNTMAKRQREADKKRKAQDKREKRVLRKSLGPAVYAPAEVEAHELSDGEVNVFEVFRKYLMVPGQMLCLGNTETSSMQETLERMTDSGLLVPEGVKGGYSLTDAGYKLMNDLA